MCKTNTIKQIYIESPQFSTFTLNMVNFWKFDLGTFYCKLYYCNYFNYFNI